MFTLKEKVAIKFAATTIIRSFLANKI